MSRSRSNNLIKDFSVQKDRIDAVLSTIFEELAGIEHERWAHWQKYMHSKCLRRADGALVIPPELVERWERLIGTRYQDLSETEKESDREQVARYVPKIASALASDL